MNIYGTQSDCCEDIGTSRGITVYPTLVARDAITPSTGDQCFVTETNTQYIWDGDSWEPTATASNLVTTVNSKIGNVVLTTTDINEGSNLYFNNTRFDNRLSTKTTDNLTQGATNKYYNVATVRTDLIDDTATALTKTYSSTKQTATFAPSTHQHPTSAITDFTASATANFNTNYNSKTTDNLPEGTTNKYYTSGQFDTDLAMKTTDNLPQGTTNKYYTSGQFDTDLAMKTTDDITQGSTNKYYSSGQFNADLATKSTTNLPEGSNLYYTQTRADNRARALIDDITPSTTKTYSSNKTDQLYTPVSHTHTTSNITNFSTGVNNIITANKGAVNGIAPLDATGKVPTANLPAGTSLTIDDGTPSTTKVWSSQKTNSEIKVKSVAGKVNDVVLVAGDIGGLNDAIDDRIPAQSVLSVASKTGSITLVPNDITGLTAEITSKIPIQTVSGRTGNVILTASDIGGLNDAIDDRLTADAVSTVAGRVGNVIIASSDIADLNTTIDGRQKVISVANKTGAVVLNSSDIGGLNTTIDNRVPVKSVAGKTGIITLVSTDITNFDTAVDARLPDIPVDSVAGKTGAVVLDSGDITDFSTAVDARTGSLINDTTPISGKVYSSVKTDSTYSKLGHTHNTGDVAETTNLYFTTARNQQLINDTTASGTTVYSSTKSNTLYAPATHNHTTANITNIQDYTDGRITLQKGANSGLATLDAQGHIPTTQIPTDVFGSGDFGTFFETPGNTYGTLTPQGTFFGFTGLQTNTSLTNNITLVENATADRITFANTGIYSINLTLSCQLTQTNSEVQLAIFQNDVQIDRLTVNRFFAAIGSGSMTISGLLPIDAGDYLDVRIAETLQTNREPDVNDVYLSFTALSNLGPRGHDGNDGVDGKDAVEIVDDLAPAVDTVYSSTKTEATYEKIGHTHTSANITDLSTTAVPEGTNLYFTTARNQQLINDNTNTTTNTYSADKINTLVAGATGISIDDTTPSGTTTYSSNKINTLNRVNTVATRTGDIVLTSADITNFNTAVDGRIPAQTITSVAGRTGNVLLTSADIGDIETYVDGRIPAQALTSVSGRTGAVVLTSSDIGDFNTSVDARIPAQTITSVAGRTGSVVITSSDIGDFNTSVDARIPAQALTSVSGRTGAVVLTSSDIGDLNTTIDARIPAQALTSVAGRTGAVVLTTADLADFNTKTDTRIGLKINDTTPSTSTLYSSTYTDGKYAEDAHTHISSEITDLTSTVDGQITAKSGTSLCPLTLGKIPTQYLPAGAGVVLDDAKASTSTVYSSTKTLQLIGDIDGAVIDDDNASLTTVYSSQFGDSRYLLGTATTDQIDEGKTNLYWTLTRNQSLIDDNSFSLGNTFSSAKITNELLNKANFLHNHDGDYAPIGHVSDNTKHIQSTLGGGNNIVYGTLAGANMTSSSNNVLIGTLAGNSITNAPSNVLIGANAGTSVSGAYNTAIGSDSLSTGGTTGNTSIGYKSLATTTGGYNTMVGVYDDGFPSLTTGSGNTLIGANSGKLLQDSSDCVMIGEFAGVDSGAKTNCIGLGNDVIVDADNTCVIGNANMAVIRTMSTTCDIGTDAKPFQKIYAGSADIPIIDYDNTASSLTATNLKSAVDELKTLVGTGAITDHTALTNIGTNTHAQIDTHIADTGVHFTEASISHANIADIGTNSHAQIDTHIADGTLHFTEGSIAHANITGIGTNSHAQIDTHIADGTLHFTEGSIAHANITGIGTNSHAQIDTHIADSSVHFTQASLNLATTYAPISHEHTNLVASTIEATFVNTPNLLTSPTPTATTFPLPNSVVFAPNIIAGRSVQSIATFDENTPSTSFEVKVDSVGGQYWHIGIGDLGSQGDFSYLNMTSYIMLQPTGFLGTSYGFNGLIGSTWTTNDIIKLEIASGNITFFKNGTQIYTREFASQTGTKTFYLSSFNGNQTASFTVQELLVSGGDVSVGIADTTNDVILSRVGSDIKAYGRLDTGLSGKELRLATPSTGQIGALTDVIPGSIIYDSTTEELKLNKTTGGWTALGGSGVSDHTLLTNIGTYTHPQIDGHIDNGDIHHTTASLNATYAPIAHSNDSTIHFTSASLAGTYSAIGHGHASTEITYDNSISGLSSSNVKLAIDELANSTITKVYGQTSMQTSTLFNSATYAVLALPTSTLIQSNFNTDNNYLQNKYAIRSLFQVSLQMTISSVNATSTHEFSVYKSGVIVPESTVFVQCPDTLKHTVNMSFILQLSFNEALEIWGRQTLNTGGCNITNFTFSVHHINDNPPLAGEPFDMPFLTSNTSQSPTYIITNSTRYLEYDGWKAFDNVDSDPSRFVTAAIYTPATGLPDFSTQLGATTEYGGWIKIAMNPMRIISNYEMTVRPSWRPKGWVIYSSNDDTNWTVRYTEPSIYNWVGSTTGTIALTPFTASYVAIVFTHSTINDAITGINELIFT